MTKAVIAQLKRQGPRHPRLDRRATSDFTIADSLGLKPAGAVVDEAQSGSPASKAGVAAGDVITTVDDAPVKDSRDLARKIGSMAPGSSVTLNIRRNAQERRLTLTLGQFPNERKAGSGAGK
jgi:serine protease Do